MSDQKLLPALTLEGNIDERDFLRFAAYDSFVRKRAWRNPLLFALIFCAFAAVCFAGRGTHAQAVLLGTLLLCVGVLLPLVWVGMFFSSVKRQARANGLSREKAQYHVTLFPEKIQVKKGKESADFPWDKVHLVYHAEGCTYLYVSAARAFLLPDCEKTELAWDIFRAHVPADRLKRKKG